MRATTTVGMNRAHCKPMYSFVIFTRVSWMIESNPIISELRERCLRHRPPKSANLFSILRHTIIATYNTRACIPNHFPAICFQYINCPIGIQENTYCFVVYFFHANPPLGVVNDGLGSRGPLVTAGDIVGTHVVVYVYNGSPCEQTCCCFLQLHQQKKHLSFAKLCSILQELTQYQAPGIE